jgi:uncharacterized heparinase superfamily protein
VSVSSVYNLPAFKSWPKETSRGLLDGLRRLTYRNPLYGITLVGRAPNRLFGTPPELMPGDAATGQIILAGNLICGGQRWPLIDMAHFPKQASDHWRAYVHGFAWLSDLRAVGSDASRELARSHIIRWIDSYTRWSPLTWRADVLGQRLTNWLTHFGFFAGDAPQEFYNLFFTEVAKQARHLNRIIMKSVTGPGRIQGLKGLIYCGVALPGYENYLHSGMRHLENELDRQIFPDGGHYSRNPHIHMEVLADLVTLRETFVAAHINVPAWLTGAIERMVPMLRALRHADGGLAFFNGASTGEPALIDTLLAKSEAKTRAISSAPHTGFHRLSAGRTTVLMDTGTPPLETAHKWAHAGTLAFEMSAGKDRIIVNCGMPEDTSPDWQQALRSTAAHSTVVVDDVNSSEINLDGGYIRQPGHVTSSRREIDGCVIIEASYDGYSKIFGLVHRRLIKLVPDGGEIQGEDNLIGSGGHRYNLSFHLHPNIQATILQDKCSALLKPRRGAGWRFTCLDRAIALEESIYFDGGRTRRRTQQIVVFGPLGETGATVKWRLSRI